MNWQALTLTARLAAAAAAILMLMGVPIALWLAYSQRRWKFMIESVVALPLILPPTVAGFRGIDRKLIAAARTLGAGQGKIYRQIILPLAWPSLITALVLSFAHTVGEFGVVLMVGGNIPGVTRTLSIDIYDQVQALNYSSAMQTALVLLTLSYLLLSLVYGLNRKVWFFAADRGHREAL